MTCSLWMRHRLTDHTSLMLTIFRKPSRLNHQGGTEQHMDWGQVNPTKCSRELACTGGLTECDDECDSDADQHSLNTTFEIVGKMRCTCASLHASLFYCYLGVRSYSLDLVPFLEVQSQGDHSSNFQRRFLRIQVVFGNTSSQLAIDI